MTRKRLPFVRGEKRKSFEKVTNTCQSWILCESSNRMRSKRVLDDDVSGTEQIEQEQSEQVRLSNLKKRKDESY